MECHQGNTPLFRLSDAGGTFYVGGWSREAKPFEGWGIIDLTGSERPIENKINAVNELGTLNFSEVLVASKMKYGPWLSMPITDYDVPSWGPRVWKALANDIRKMLDSGTSILMCCQGGHGRTGLAASILVYILKPELCAGKHPIEFVREKHCHQAVENQKQIDYVCKILESFGLNPELGKNIHASKIYTPSTTYNHQDDYYKPQNMGKARAVEDHTSSRLVWNAADHVKTNGGLMDDWTNTFGL